MIDPGFKIGDRVRLGHGSIYIGKIHGILTHPNQGVLYAVRFNEPILTNYTALREILDSGWTLTALSQKTDLDDKLNFFYPGSLEICLNDLEEEILTIRNEIGL